MIKSDLSEPWIFGHNMTINVSYGDFYTSFPTHWHNFVEIIAPLSDSYSVQIGNTIYELNEKSIALISPRTLHSITKSPGQPHLIIQFPNTVLQQLHDFIRYRQILYGSSVLQAQDPLFEEDPLAILLNILDCNNVEPPFKELHMYELLLHFFIVIGNHNLLIKNQLSAQKTPRQKEEDLKFSAVTDYMYEHCTDKITMEKVAEFAGFSKYHFSRIFKEYYQMSFPEYIASLRISKATELLENSSLSILEIAMQSGFSNLSSFNRAFKEINNCTPSQFRKMADFSPGA